MKFDFVIWFALIMLVVGVFVGLTGIAPPFVLTTTKYAPRYLEAAFRRVKIGDSTNSVFKTVGRPLRETGYDNGKSLWSYTAPSWSLWSQGRWLWFSNDVV